LFLSVYTTFNYQVILQANGMLLNLDIIFLLKRP